MRMTPISIQLWQQRDNRLFYEKGSPMNRIWKWLNTNPKGICIQFGLVLIVVVGGIFGYFSITACNSTNANSPSSCDDPGKLPPSQPPTSTHSSAWTSSTTIIKPDMEPSITNTGSLNPAPGSLAERKLSWSGNQPDRLTYHPPLGATDLVFTDPTKQPQPGGPPYFFNNPPKDIPAQFNFFPALPAGKPKWTVTETLQSTNATGAQSVTLETTLGSKVALGKAPIKPDRNCNFQKSTGPGRTRQCPGHETLVLGGECHHGRHALPADRGLAPVKQYFRSSPDPG